VIGEVAHGPRRRQRLQHRGVMGDCDRARDTDRAEHSTITGPNSRADRVRAWRWIQNSPNRITHVIGTTSARGPDRRLETLDADSTEIAGVIAPSP